MTTSDATKVDQSGAGAGGDIIVAPGKTIAKSYTRIAENVKNLLRRDLARQDTFEKAEQIDFSFEKDRISVNGESFFLQVRWFI